MLISSNLNHELAKQGQTGSISGFQTSPMVFSSGTVDLLDVNLEMYKKQRDEKGSWLYLLFVVLWEVMPYTPGNLFQANT
jgi:hypothetical protein